MQSEQWGRGVIEAWLFALLETFSLPPAVSSDAGYESDRKSNLTNFAS